MTGYISRAEWGARYADGQAAAPLPAAEWWLHHSAGLAPDLTWTDTDRDGVDDDERRAMRALEEVGQQRFGAGISYTWLVMPSGRVYEGHSMDRRGTHTAGRNSKARAVCLVGNYEAFAPSDAQLGAVARLLVAEHAAGRAATHELAGGHRDLKATACPGQLAYARIPDINARAAALWAAGTPCPGPAAPPPAREVPAFPLPAGHYYGPAAGPAVSVSNTIQPRQPWVDGLTAWQSRMRARGWAVAVTGRYGDDTARVARGFQAEKGLRVDGLIGEQTWRAAWAEPIT